MQKLAQNLVRGLLAPGLALVLMVVPVAAATTLPKTPEVMVEMIRKAIETKDYDALKTLVFWKGTGKIKKRIVRFHLNRNLGRKIKSISLEPFPEDGMKGILATGKLAPNMKVSHFVRVVFDEAPIKRTGRYPTAVFLVGPHRDVYRIGLVNRAGPDDDDD